MEALVNTENDLAALKAHLANLVYQSLTTDDSYCEVWADVLPVSLEVY